MYATKNQDQLSATITSLQQRIANYTAMPGNEAAWLTARYHDDLAEAERDFKASSEQSATITPSKREAMLPALVIITVLSVFAFAVFSALTPAPSAGAQGETMGAIVRCWNRAEAGESLAWHFGMRECVEVRR